MTHTGTIRFLRQANPKDLRGTALVRLDFNTEDDWRLQTALPTIRFLFTHASKIVILSHKGRPTGVKISNGVPSGFDKKTSLRNSAHDLEKFLHRKISFIPHFRFKEIKKIIARAPEKSIFVLENIRFLRGENTKRPELARQLASLADYYVNDAFAVCHRTADSVSGIERFLPSFGGLELEKEIKFLSHILARPKKPLVVILGGGKAIDKLGVLTFFKKRAGVFLLGGATANTILYLKGIPIGNSLADRDPTDLKKIRNVLAYRNVLLPSDWVQKNGKILDIGPDTIAAYERKIAAARTIIWNGPMGLIEKSPYARGTLAVARAIVKNHDAFSVAGGGETVMFLKKYKLDRKFSFISTGGTAMLDFLAGEKLPGIEALRSNRKYRESTLNNANSRY